MMVKKGKKRARASLQQTLSTKLPKKKIEKKTEDNKPKSGKSLLIAQEVKFARLLASNDKKVRDKVLKTLKKWLKTRSQSSFAFTETDFLRLWKGLFYCMWMSDKPLVQEDLAESLSRLVHCFSTIDAAILYTKSTLKSLSAEWFGIDRFRIDKFEMLVRKIIRQTFEMCKKHSWNKDWIVEVGKVMQEILIDSKTSLGLSLHITEIYMEELAKISEGSIPKNMVTELIRPFVIYLINVTDQRQVKHIVKHIFRYLIFQSDVGMDYTEKFQAWKNAGFPCQNIDEIQKIEVSDDEEIKNEIRKEKLLDPRAGRIDVEIPQISFDPSEIACVLKQNKFHESSTTKTRKQITKLIEDFTKLADGYMPFGITEIPVPEVTKVNCYEFAEQLLEFEKELYSDSSKNSRKRKINSNSSKLCSDMNIEKEVLYSNVNKTSIIKKKKKLINNISTKENNEVDRVEKGESNKVVVMNITDKNLESIPISNSNKVIQKLNKTLSNGTIISGSIKTDFSSSKDATCCNWNVDATTPQSHDSVLSKIKVLENNSLPLKKKILLKKKSQINASMAKPSASWLTPVLTRLEEQSKDQTSQKSVFKHTKTTDSAKKRVKIMLQKNTAQCTSEYFRQIKMSPSIPFDANRKPKAGVLKPSPLPSPVNPFYKKKFY